MNQLASRFRLLQPLGKGGMGEVFLAHDQATKREVALKRLRPGLVSDPAALVREFSLLATIRHPAIVEVFDLGYGLDGGAWYSMEYVPGSAAEGETVRSSDWVSQVAASVISGLEALHGAGIVHGDLKPSNVLVVDGAEAIPAASKIVDFGLASHVSAPSQRGGGTAGFTAPEVVQGSAVTPASDLFSFGCCLTKLLTGDGPFDGQTAADRYRSLLTGTPSVWRLEAAGAPSWMISLILRLLATDPGSRPRSAREVRQELQRASSRIRPTLHTQLETVQVIGRERELARLEEWSRTGPPLLALVGEPGVGRTALLHALAARMAVLGRTIVRIDGASGHDNFSALQIQLENGTREATEGPNGTHNGRAVAMEGPELDALVDTLRAHRPGTPGAPNHALIVLLDNADVLPAEVRRFLRRVALETSGAVRVLLTCTTLPPDEEPLQLAGALTEEPLLPLPRPSLERLVSARLSYRAPAALVDWLWKMAGGHPGLSLEMLRLAVSRGAITEDENDVVIDAALLATLAVPESFFAAHRDRLRDASPAARRLALAVALRGGSSDRELLAPLFGEQLESLHAELAAGGVFTTNESGRMVLSRTIAPVAVELAEPGERQLMHAALARSDRLTPSERFHHLAAAGEREAALACAATMWSEFPENAPAAFAAEIAEGVDPAQAGAWYDRAIQQAWSTGAHREAQTLAQRVVSAAAGRFATPERWERLAAASFRCGQLELTQQALAAGLAADPSAATRGRLLITEAAMHHARGDFTGALEIAEAAMDCLREAGNSEHMGDAALTASSILIALGRLDDAESRLDQAITVYTHASRPLGLTRAAQMRGLLLRHRGALAEAEKAYIYALELARACSSRLPLQETYMHLGQLYGDLGRGDDCRDAYHEARQLALADGRGAAVTLATLNLAQFEGLSGRPREAVRLARGAIELARLYLPAQEFLAWRALVQGLRALGRLDEAAKAVENMLTLGLAQANDEDQAWCRVEACRLLLERQQSKEALRLASRFRPSDPAAWNAGQAMLECLAGRAALWESDRHRAAAAAINIRKWLERHPHRFVAATAFHLEAELALRQGRVEEAIQFLAKSVAAFETIPCTHERAMALLETARLAAEPQADGRLPVSDWLRQAAPLFARLGNRRRQVQAAELEAEWLRKRAEYPVLEMEHGLLERVGRMLHAVTDYRELTHQALALAVEQFNAERGVLVVKDEATGEFEPVAHYGAEDAGSQRQILRFSRSLVREVATEAKSVLVYDAPHELESASLSMEELKLRALLGVPIFLHGQVVGVVYLDSRHPGAFAESDRRLLDGFAQLMAAALDSNRAAQRLSHDSLIRRREIAARVRAGLLGSSQALQELMPAIERAASSFAPILLTGETGSGKGLIANLIHEQSHRSSGPYLSINCGAFTAEVLASELFGVVERAYTGVRPRPGRFQKAKGGTLFLDEIGEMPLDQQVALLSAIDNREVTPLGADEPVPTDVRIIAATNRDLEKMVEAGTFRQDLFYRLNVLRIRLPALRERKGDIPELARHFASQIAARNSQRVPELGADLLADLMSSDWPGNVRELENYIERLMTMPHADVLHSEPAVGHNRRVAARAAQPRRRKLVDELNALERRLLIEELRRCDGNQSRAARALGLSEPTFRNKLSKHGLWSRRKLRNR